MLKNKKIIGRHNLTKEEIIKNFSINSIQKSLIEKYLQHLLDYNSHTNLVGNTYDNREDVMAV